MERDITNMAMEKQIAVLVDKSGNISSGSDAAAIVKYIKEGQLWKDISKIWLTRFYTERSEFEEELDTKTLEEQLKQIRNQCHLVKIGRIMLSQELAEKNSIYCKARVVLETLILGLFSKTGF